METSDNIYTTEGEMKVGKTITVKKSKGLGDTIEKFTHATGLNTFADMAAKLMGKDDCGCGDRKDKLNEMFPYKK